MTLHAIVRALGGDLYDGGRRANIPAPNHSAADRSVSLLLEGDRVVVHTFGDSDWKAVLDHLRAHRLIDQGNVPLAGEGLAVLGRPASAGGTALERLEVAARLWDQGVAVGRTVSARHCRLRGIGRELPGPQALRHLAETPVSVYRPGRHRRPALLAGIRGPAGCSVAVEITYLAPNGQRASDLRLPRKTVGAPPPGSAVRLDPAAPDMLVAEGVFTTLSATEWFGLPGWALLSTSNLRAWSPPPGVRSVLIAADRGADGERSAAVLQDRLVAEGLSATVAPPPGDFGDWNEWSCSAERRKNAAAAAERRPAG